MINKKLGYNNEIIQCECNGVTVSMTGENTYHINFLNGSLDLDLNKKDPLVLGTGCGSGKTTAFCLLMLMRLHKGILYVTDRTDDLDRVYKWLMENAVGEAFIGANGMPFLLKKEDIVNLHNNLITDDKGNVINGVDIEKYNNNPGYIQNALILLATSYKFTHEYPENLMLLAKNASPVMHANPFETSVKGKVSLGMYIPPRETVFIDELITCDLMNKTFTRFEIENLGRKNIFVYMGPTNSKYTHGDSHVSCTKEYNTDILSQTYSSLLKCRPELSFGRSGTPASKLKDQLMMYSIHARYDEIMNNLLSNNLFQYTHTHNILSYIFENTKVNIIMAEGTAEYLMCDKVNSLGQIVERSKFKLLTYPNKYNSPIHVERFEYPFDSRVVKQSDILKVGGIDDVITPKLNNVAEEINKIIKRPEVNKVLVFTWMNLKSKLDIKPEVNGSSILKYMLNEDFNMVEYIRNRVSIPKGKTVVFSHYQSGEDKATNDYRDFDSIVFSGYFRIPELAIDRLNKYYGYSTNSFMYTVHQVTQAISRTRIRLHKRLPINIYFSSDWDERVVNEVIRYIGNNESPDNKIVVTDKTLDWIKNKWKPVIIKLGSYDPNFMNAILTKSNYVLNIGLDEIYELIPMDRKRTERYSSLVSYLRLIGIELNIKSEIGRNQYSKS